MSLSDVPVRQYMTDSNTSWRYGKPDYSVSNNRYLSERTKFHKAGSLEKLVENLIKTWEMESVHKQNVKDWQTVDKEKFFIQANGGKKFSADENVRVGNYKMMMEASPLDDTTVSDASYRKLYMSAFPGGFPWELLELITGPPKLTFTWRHWTTWSGPFKDVQPTNEKLELTGCCIANVNKDMKLESMEIFFDPNPMLGKLMDLKNENGTKISACPFHKGE